MYQSLGARGITALSGQALNAWFPVGLPWFRFALPEEVLVDPEISEEAKAEANSTLGVNEMLATAALESSRSNFRSRKSASIDQLVVTGDTLEMLTKELQLVVFRRDQYTTYRDSSGRVLQHIIKEQLDPLSLDEERFVRTGLNRTDLARMKVGERLEKHGGLYTHVAWQPWTKTWLVRQQMNDRDIYAAEEEVSPYFSTAYELAPGEHYGRGFVESVLGDLRSLNQLSKDRLDIIGLAAKGLIAVDHGSPTREKDLARESGRIIRARVAGGQVQDVGPVQFTSSGEHQILTNGLTAIEQRLGAAMLLGADSVRDSERTTAFEVQNITVRELENAIGGLYVKLAEDQQYPLLKRLVFQLRKDKILRPIPIEGVREQVELLTGAAALAKQARARDVLQFASVAAQLGPEAVRRIDTSVLMDVLQRYSNLYEPGLVKDQATVDAEDQQAMRMQAEQAAVAEGISVAGDAAREAATQAAVEAQ